MAFGTYGLYMSLARLKMRILSKAHSIYALTWHALGVLIKHNPLLNMSWILVLQPQSECYI